MRSFKKNNYASAGIMFMLILLVMCFSVLEYQLNDNNNIFMNYERSMSKDWFNVSNAEVDNDPDVHFFNDPIGWFGDRWDDLTGVVSAGIDATVSVLQTAWNFLGLLGNLLALNFVFLGYLGVLQWAIKIPIWIGLMYGFVKALPTT